MAQFWESLKYKRKSGILYFNRTIASSITQKLKTHISRTSSAIQLLFNKSPTCPSRLNDRPRKLSSMLVTSGHSSSPQNDISNGNNKKRVMPIHHAWRDTVSSACLCVWWNDEWVCVWEHYGIRTPCAVSVQ